MPNFLPSGNNDNLGGTSNTDRWNNVNAKWFQGFGNDTTKGYPLKGALVLGDFGSVPHATIHGIPPAAGAVAGIEASGPTLNSHQSFQYVQLFVKGVIHWGGPSHDGAQINKTQIQWVFDILQHNNRGGPITQIEIIGCQVFFSYFENRQLMFTWPYLQLGLNLTTTFQDYDRHAEANYGWVLQCSTNAGKNSINFRFRSHTGSAALRHMEYVDLGIHKSGLSYGLWSGGH